MTAEDLAQKLGVRASLVEREFRATARGVRASAQQFCRGKLVEEIYAIPEDMSPTTGKKRWQRTRNLLRNEKAEVTDPFTVVVRNDQPYAVARHEAGKPGRRAINPLRESHWRDELVETFRPLLTELYHDTVLAILEGTR